MLCCNHIHHEVVEIRAASIVEGKEGDDTIDTKLMVEYNSNGSAVLETMDIHSNSLLQGQKKAPHHTKALQTTSFLKQKSRNMFLTTDVGGKSWKLFHPTDVMNIHKISKPIASHLAMLLATTSIWVASYKKGLNYLY